MAQKRRPGVLATKVARAVQEAKQPASVLAPMCPSRGILEHVTSRWGVLVLVSLLEDTHRFSELRRKVMGVSEKMLTQHLREMEADGLVHREVYAEVPPRVEYSLTEHGRTLNQALGPLGAWGTERIRREGCEQRQPQPDTRSSPR